MNYKVLNTIGKKYTKEAMNILKDLGSVDYLDLSQDKFEKIIGKYDIVLVGIGLNITKRVIDNGHNLKIIATATTGIDHIDFKYANEKRIKIVSLKDETEFLNTITGTSELAFGLIINLARLVCPSFASVKEHKWQRENFKGSSLYGKTLGIFGLGRLGKQMARYAKAFNMEVIAYDPYIDLNVFKKNNCEQVNFDELLRRSDVISIHVHLDEETENIFDRKVFLKMKSSAYLINTSRGKIVNEDDLLDALKGKKIAAYATDTLAGELDFQKKFKNYLLVDYAKNNNNCLIVPHIGGMTYESRSATDIFIAKKILKNI